MFRECVCPVVRARTCVPLTDWLVQERLNVYFGTDALEVDGEFGRRSLEAGWGPLQSPLALERTRTRLSAAVFSGIRSRVYARGAPSTRHETGLPPQCWCTQHYRPLTQQCLELFQARIQPRCSRGEAEM